VDAAPNSNDGTSAAQAPRPGAWPAALAVTFVLLGGLGLLLARLIFLPYYCGLFFYLVAGLLAGGLSFRIARPARPIAGRRLLTGVLLLSLFTTLIITLFEFDYVARTIGDEPKFPDARNAALSEGRPTSEVSAAATREFKAMLRRAHPPGGAWAYVRWSMAGGKATLVVGGAREQVRAGHVGWTWPIRTLAGSALLAAGLWASFESLRSHKPVTNILPRGEDYEPLDD
jgi:hypothetical protein